MTQLRAYLILALAAGLSGAPAQGQGSLGLLQQGQYVCALPGNAAGAAWEEAPERNFRITGASSYRTDAGAGTYLLEGRKLSFTRGPFRGQRMMLMNSGLLQELDADGHMGRLRCHRARGAAS